MTGLQAAREITHRKPEVRVLMLSMHDNEQYLFEAIEAGASGLRAQDAPSTATSSRPAARRCAASRSSTPAPCGR